MYQYEITHVTLYIEQIMSPIELRDPQLFRITSLDSLLELVNQVVILKSAITIYMLNFGYLAIFPYNIIIMNHVMFTGIKLRFQGFHNHVNKILIKSCRPLTYNTPANSVFRFTVHCMISDLQVECCMYLHMYM